MIRPKLSLRRPLAVLGATFVGLAAAVAVAAPASAHHSEIKVVGDCDTNTGNWVVTWTVNSYAPNEVKNYKFIEVNGEKAVGDAVTPMTVDGIAVTDGDSYPHAVGTPLVAKQELPGDTTRAKLTVKSKWENGFVENEAKSATIDFAEPCKKKETPPPATAKPTASVVADCDGNVEVKLTNAQDATAPARFVVKAENGYVTKRVTVAPGGNATVNIEAKYATKVTVTEKNQQEPLYDKAPTKPENCVEPGEPAGSYKSTCDALVFEVSNPKDGKEVTVTFTPNKGEKQTLTVAPGETKTVQFKGVEGLTVQPSAEGMDDTEAIAWKKPADCKTDEPTLPVTGAAAGSIAAGAGVLLVAGAVLFVVARRRRVKFTA